MAGTPEEMSEAQSGDKHGSAVIPCQPALRKSEESAGFEGIIGDLSI